MQWWIMLAVGILLWLGTAVLLISWMHRATSTPTPPFPSTDALKKTKADVEWLHNFINCVPFGADAPVEHIQRAHEIVNDLVERGNITNSIPFRE
jgi:hypothetical protein